MAWFEPLTERYNNPGALEYQPWMEKYGARVGENGRYAQFDSPDDGYNVMGKVLDTYQNKHGLNTVSGIVGRWAPSNVDNNSTSGYTQKVASELGIDPNAQLTPEQRPALMRAMASYESGRKAPMPGQTTATPPTGGQNAMAGAYPWNMLQWPNAVDPSVGDLNPGMQSGPLAQPRPDQAAMFASVPPQDAPQPGPPMPPPRGPEGGQGMPPQTPPGGGVPSLQASIANMGMQSQPGVDSQPNWLQKLSMNPLVMGGIMTALDASRGGSGVEGFKAGAGSAAGIQDAWAKDYQLRRQIEQNKAVNALMNDPKSLSSVPAPLLAIARATQDPSLISKYTLEQNKPQFTTVGTDQFGQPLHGFVNQATKTVEPYTGPGSQTANSGSQLTGDEFLKTLPANTQATLKAYQEGRIQFPTGTALRSPQNQRMLQMMQQYDPNFDAVNYAARAKTRQDFASGKSAQNLTSFNTTMAHIDTLDKAIDGLGNSDYTWVNQAKNAAAGPLGMVKQQEALKKFTLAKTAAVDELTRAFRGTGGNVHDLVQWEKSLSEADSPKALKAATKQALGLLEGRINALGEQYNRGMGTTKDGISLLSPKAQAAYRRLTGEEPPSASMGKPGATKEAAAPKRLRFNPTTGELE